MPPKRRLATRLQHFAQSHMIPHPAYNPFHHGAGITGFGYGGARHHMPVHHMPVHHTKRRAPKRRGGLTGFGVGAGLLLGGARAKAAAMKAHRERHGVARVINPKTGREVWADSKIGQSVVRRMGL